MAHDIFLKMKLGPQNLSVLSEHKEAQQICTFYSHFFFIFSVLTENLNTLSRSFIAVFVSKVTSHLYVKLVKASPVFTET